MAAWELILMDKATGEVVKRQAFGQKIHAMLYAKRCDKGEGKYTWRFEFTSDREW